jgi:rare lipoprotein A
MRLANVFLVFSSLAFLSGCALLDPRQGGEPGTTESTTTTAGKNGKGGYYKDDGPGDNPPANLASIPDAVPKIEPVYKANSNPYTALGRDYVPMAEARGFRQEGLASWYGRRYHGKPTSTGEPYDMYAMSAAHPTLPLPSYVRVTNPANKRSVVVRVNDRGPFHDGRIIDVSYTAAWKLDILKGVTPVVIEVIDPAAPPPPAVLTTPLKPLPMDPEGAAYLQLGAFSNADGAEEFAQRVRQRLGDRLPDVKYLLIDNLFKVHAGPFADPAQAEQAAEAIERELGIQPFKVKR